MEEISGKDKGGVIVRKRKCCYRCYRMIGFKLLVGMEVWIQLFILDVAPLLPEYGPGRTKSLGEIGLPPFHQYPIIFQG